MYEQRNKDIDKASAESLYRISRVLGCTIEDLIEKYKPISLRGARDGVFRPLTTLHCLRCLIPGKVGFLSPLT